MPVVLYGIVRADHPLPAQERDAGPGPALGIGHPAASLRLVRSGPLAAVVSETTDLGELGEHEAIRHLEILQRLLADGPVLPVRLGTVAPDDESVRTEVLEPVQDGLPEQLDAIDGLVELYLDIEEEEQVELAEAVAGTPLAYAPPPDDLDARIQLGQQIADLVVARRTAQAEEILDDLRPLARADRPRRHHGGPEDPALSWAFLVPADRLPDFDAAVERVRAARPSLKVDYVGPLPAVDFVDFPARVLTTAPAADTTGDAFGGSGRWGWGGEGEQRNTREPADRAGSGGTRDDRERKEP
ncbi:Gas vesicle synthesis protein GvpL/GvpF [Parafrankia irregularis]|uniref:Gas vesicle synthesis protein GvpL/GvpF n=1 Tax=Parafrankia irregularis TaxID=795642 RepID=A0A0S4QVW2_9ACTN|nr:MULTISPECIES: GvpL/GvpF family gas vesicle protein [Parafrankia]MBE3202562.1 GvpL/GvpF family gas vesicle protein [Parafrankia sp. CH37]CUU59819.1 Gas vesicle synthesis protein GvpL/GvpF [Parafrankia irregularis]